MKMSKISELPPGLKARALSYLTGSSPICDSLTLAFPWAMTTEGSAFWADVCYRGVYDGRYDNKTIKQL